MSLYKVRQSWLYTTAKRNRIPICRIAGKNYYNKKHVDEFFGMAVDMESITDWLLTEKSGRAVRHAAPATVRSLSGPIRNPDSQPTYP